MSLKLDVDAKGNNLNLIMPIFLVLKGCLLNMSSAYTQMYFRNLNPLPHRGAF